MGEVDETDVYGTFDALDDPLDAEKASREEEDEDRKISKPQSEEGAEGNYVVGR